MLLVGERSNSNGSKKFRTHLLEGDIEGMVQMGRSQVREGSHVLDVCTAYVGRDETADMTKLLDPMVQKVTAPIRIEKTNMSSCAPAPAAADWSRARRFRR